MTAFLRIEVPAAAAELCADAAWTVGCLGIEEVATGERGCVVLIVSVDNVLVTHMRSALARFGEPVAIERDTTGWVESWKPWARVLDLGELRVGPPWVEMDDPAVRIDPGRAWGHGAHPTTELILRWLTTAAERSGSLCDVGSGSGVLAVTAAALGCSSVAALDVDPEAPSVIAANARRNGVSVELVDDTAPALAATGRRFDVVVANIDAPVLEELAPALVALTRPGGMLVLSGMLNERSAAVQARFTDSGAGEIVWQETLDGWTAVAVSLPPQCSAT